MSDTFTPGPIQTLILAFDGVNLLDIAGPLQAYEASEPRRDEAVHYRTTVASIAGGEIRTSTRMPIMTQRLAELDAMQYDTVMVGGGGFGGSPLVPADLVEWVGRNGARVRRMCSICAGAFILGAAGILDGRRATTHWLWTRRLQNEHPKVQVQPDAIYVSDGPVWTSAGVTAGIDMTLALIQQDYGHRAAIEAARRLVVFMKRPGGQSQFSAPMIFQSGNDDRFSDLHAWMRENLHADLRVERLAREAGMSERAFSRAYGAAMGQTPAKTVEAMRFELACSLLVSTGLSLKQVADVCGLGQEQNLRRIFMRRLGLAPLDYRARFGGA